MPDIQNQFPPEATNDGSVKCRVLLADDHAVVRESLKNLLEQQGCEIVGEASNGRDALTLAIQLNPDVVVLDLGMPILNGIQATQELSRRLPGTPTILLTMHNEKSYVHAGREAGAAGYVLKTQAAADLVEAIREVTQGRTYVSPDISDAWHEGIQSREGRRQVALTEREREVLQLVIEGKSSKQIAHVLNIATRTAEAHRTHIMKKLDVRNLAGLIRCAIQHHLTII